MGSNLWEWYEKSVFQIVDQVASHFLSTSERASIDDFSSKISAAKVIAKRPQLYPSVWFRTSKELTINSFTQFL